MRRPLPHSTAFLAARRDGKHIALNVTTVAEGVENAETAAYLRNCGCGVAQGIYYSPPVAAPAIMELIASPAPR
jgi:diguanylate cyclase